MKAILFIPCHSAPIPQLMPQDRMNRLGIVQDVKPTRAGKKVIYEGPPASINELKEIFVNHEIQMK